jgi:hypothetical protein
VLTGLATCYPRPVIGDVPEARRLCGVLRIDDCLNLGVRGSVKHDAFGLQLWNVIKKAEFQPSADLGIGSL